MAKKIEFIAATPEIYLSEDPPKPAYQTLPEWFKKIPPEVSIEQHIGSTRDRSTVKKCVPFLDAMTAGYMLCLPQDIEIKKVDGSTHIFWGVNRPNGSVLDMDTPAHRSAGLPVPEGYDKNIWRVTLYPRVRTPKGSSILVTHPFNRYDLPFLTLSGVIDTDISVRPSVANIYIKDNFEGIIEKGTPIAQIFPFVRQNWEHEIKEPLSEEESEKERFKIMSKLVRSYQSQFWVKKSYK